MSSYGGSAFSFNNAAGIPAWEIRTNSSTRSSILEIGITGTTAASIAVGLGRPAARGTILPGYTFPLLPEERTDGAYPSNTVICLAWQVNPTVPVQYVRKVFSLAAVGAGIIWTFARGLVIPVDGSMVLWNIAAGPDLNSWVLVKE